MNVQKQTAIELTSRMMHKHYCENDGEAVIALLGEPFSWFGPGDQEYAVGREVMVDILRQFSGLVPKCNISDEHYEVVEISPDVLLCLGRMWIVTDPSTNIYLRVHQRVTAVYLRSGEELQCCHMHLSNPYTEMTESDVGFPAQMGRHSYEYLQERIREQKQQIAMQTAMLERLSFEDTLTGLFNRNKFNQKIEQHEAVGHTHLGVACMDLNGLKPINDQLGHSAGDEVIQRTARHIQQCFAGKAYRIGGDEFVIIDDESDEAAFYQALDTMRKHLEDDQLSVSIGISWRSSGGSIPEQFDQADCLMYEDKANFYSSPEHNRRRRRDTIMP